MTPRERILKRLPIFSAPVLVVLIYLFWKAVIELTGVSRFVLPEPEEAFGALWGLLQEPETWNHARITATESVAGFMIAVVLGVIVGAILGRIVWLERALSPAIIAFQVLPKVALVPLLIIWFGFGMTSKVLLATILAFFPVMLNVLLGVRSVEQGQREVMRSLNATRRQTFSQLEMRSLMPYLFAGMEVGIVLATTGAIVGEYLGGNQGLGFMVVSAMNSLDAARTFALILLLSIMGLVLFLIVNELKRFFIPWHESVYGLRNR
jgi:NitT/TauT family transport system permease protein